MGWVVGAVLAGIGSCSSNLGVNIQKYSFVLNSQKDKALQIKYYKNPLWLLGLLLVSFGSMGDFIALSMCAQSIVAPIGSVTLVTNVLFAHFGLHEKLRYQDILGTLLIISGSILSVAFGDHNSRSYTATDLTYMYTGTLFIVYTLLIALLLTIFHIFINRMNPLRNKLIDTIRRWETIRDNPVQQMLSSTLDKQIHILEQQYSRFEKLHPFTLCSTAGLYGSLSVLFGKMVAELLGSTLNGSNQMNQPQTYVFAIIMFIFVVLQLHYMASALNLFDAMYCVPVFQCFFISGSTLGGACFFNEFQHFGLIQGILFPVGLSLTLGGVIILSSRQMHLKRTTHTTNMANTTQTLSIQQYTHDKSNKRTYSNGKQHTLLKDNNYATSPSAYIDDQYVNDLTQIEEESDNDVNGLSKSYSSNDDFTALDNNNITSDTEYVDPELQTPVKSNTTTSTVQRSNMLLRPTIQTLLSSNKRNISAPSTVAQQQQSTQQRKLRQSPLPVQNTTSNNGMQLSYDIVVPTQHIRTPRTQLRQTRTINNNILNKNSIKQPSAPPVLDTTKIQIDPELAINTLTNSNIQHLNNGLSQQHDHIHDLDSSTLDDNEHDLSLLSDEAITERLKWYSSVGNISSGLYGQLPLLGPIAQIILNATKQQNNDNNDDDDDTIAETLFGHQYHNIDTLHSSNYNTSNQHNEHNISHNDHIDHEYASDNNYIQPIQTKRSISHDINSISNNNIVTPKRSISAQKHINNNSTDIEMKDLPFNTSINDISLDINTDIDEHDNDSTSPQPIKTSNRTQSTSSNRTFTTLFNSLNTFANNITGRQTSAYHRLNDNNYNNHSSHTQSLTKALLDNHSKDNSDNR